jgi:hypothetical protein
MEYARCAAGFSSFRSISSAFSLCPRRMRSLKRGRANVKTTQERPQDAVALTQEEAETIVSDCGASAGECWICEMFVQKLRKDQDGLFLLPEALEDGGLVEHLRQIIGRDVDEEPLSQSR